MTWIAGWNQPGYLPDTEPTGFDTWVEAHRSIVAEVERWWNEVYTEADNAAYLEAHTALHLATEGQPYDLHLDGYVWWVQSAEKEGAA